MANVKKAIHLKGGGTLLFHYDGKKTYIPSKRYRDFKQAQPILPFKRKTSTEENCNRLLTAIFSYPVSMGDLHMTYKIEGTSVKLVVWKN